MNMDHAMSASGPLGRGGVIDGGSGGAFGSGSWIPARVCDEIAGGRLRFRSRRGRERAREDRT